MDVNPQPLWTWAFIKRALESALVTGLTTFYASSSVTTWGSWLSIKTSLITAGMGALYQLIKNLGSTQTLQALQSLNVQFMRSKEKET
jgi:hypothetical protein